VGFLLLWSLSGEPIPGASSKVRSSPHPFLEHKQHPRSFRDPCSLIVNCRYRANGSNAANAVFSTFAYATIGKLRLRKFRLRVPLNNYKVLIAAGSSAPCRRW
jgi:hypothetical protein